MPVIPRNHHKTSSTHFILIKIVILQFIFTTFVTSQIQAQSPSETWQAVGSDLAPNFTNPSTFIGDLLGGGEQQPGIIAIAIVLGGIAMFIMLLFGGFTMLTNPTNPQGQEAGKQRITWAVIGFFILFGTFWIIQILEIIFGINIT